jgi:membrane protein
MKLTADNKLKKLIDLVKATFKDWSEDKAARLAAALAYYTVFSIPPLLIIVLAIVGQFFDRNSMRDQLMAQIGGLIGQQGADFIKGLLESASKPAESTVAAVLGLITLLLGATGVFGELQGALNTIWEVAPKPGRGLLGTMKDRFLSFTMVLGIGFLLMVSLVLSTALAALSNFVAGDTAQASGLLEILNSLASVLILTVMFALMFKIIPDAEIAWRDVWLGAAFTALLFTIGKYVIGLYLGRSSVASTYGAAGSLVVILIWIYYSAQILFLGAEFTQVYANRYGSRVRPAADAIPITDEARAQQGIPRQSTREAPSTTVPGQTADATAVKHLASAGPAVSPKKNFV